MNCGGDDESNRRFSAPLSTAGYSRLALTCLIVHFDRVVTDKTSAMVTSTALPLFSHRRRLVVGEASRAKRSVLVILAVPGGRVEFVFIALEAQLPTQLAIFVFELRS